MRSKYRVSLLPHLGSLGWDITKVWSRSRIYESEALEGPLKEDTINPTPDQYEISQNGPVNIIVEYSVSITAPFLNFPAFRFAQRENTFAMNVPTKLVIILHKRILKK